MCMSFVCVGTCAKHAFVRVCLHACVLECVRACVRAYVLVRVNLLCYSLFVTVRQSMFLGVGANFCLLVFVTLFLFGLCSFVC